MAHEQHKTFHTTDDLAQIERQTAKTAELKNSWIGLLASLVLFSVSLVFPFTGKATGIDVLFANQKAAEFGASPLEQMYIVCGIITVVITNIVVILTRKSVLAYITWILAGTTLVFGMFTIWIGQTRLGAPGSSGSEFGAWINVISVVLFTAVISFVAFRRSDKQIDVAEARREFVGEDLIQSTQDGAAVAKRYSRYEDNPLFIDDRRAQAAARRRRK